MFIASIQVCFEHGLGIRVGPALQAMFKYHVYFTCGPVFFLCRMAVIRMTMIVIIERLSEIHLVEKICGTSLISISVIRCGEVGESLPIITELELAPLYSCVISAKFKKFCVIIIGVF